jgi:hypothetical protein
MDEMERFSSTTTRMRGRLFKPIARRGAAEGVKLIKSSTAKVPKQKR